VPLFVVGGVSTDTLHDYLAAGAIGAGIGGELYRPGQALAQTRAQAAAFRQAYLDHA
jgi:2-dehydro-3-deoxyphosphogalactonate aldolase